MFLEANLKKLVVSSVHTSLHPYILKRSLPGNFPGGSEVKASASNAGDRGSIPGLGRLPGEGNGIPLQESCRENFMDRGVCRATVHGFTNT